jgi:formimidoylglutamate deiminase
MPKAPQRAAFRSIWLSTGWAENAELEIDSNGLVSGITLAKKPPRGAFKGIAIPAPVNAHSHAFQRAFAGLTEKKGADDFWAWRQVMYQGLLKITPESLAAIAGWLYAEMVKAGYGGVCEFHYLHRRPDGRSTRPPTALADAIVAAAKASGIDLTLLPVLYQREDFNTTRVAASQRAFYNALGDFRKLVSSLRKNHPSIGHGVAIHSLRAVPEEVVKNAGALFRDGPIHIHVAEQAREVETCLRVHRKRPVEWLLENASLSSRWNLVHATHATPDELRALARNRVTVVLCPTTEANLGDGIFSFADFAHAEGGFAIGSDSNVSVDPREELRLLEYGQRLIARKRAIAADSANPHPAANLWKAAVAGGLKAAGRTGRGIEVGAPATLAVLDENSAVLAGRTGDEALDALVFAGQPTSIRDVMVRGKWVVRDFRHVNETRLKAAYRKALATL